MKIKKISLFLCLFSYQNFLFSADDDQKIYDYIQEEKKIYKVKQEKLVRKIYEQIQNPVKLEYIDNLTSDLLFLQNNIINKLKRFENSINLLKIFFKDIYYFQELMQSFFKIACSNALYTEPEFTKDLKISTTFISKIEKGDQEIDENENSIYRKRFNILIYFFKFVLNECEKYLYTDEYPYNIYLIINSFFRALDHSKKDIAQLFWNNFAMLNSINPNYFVSKVAKEFYLRLYKYKDIKKEELIIIVHWFLNMDIDFNNFNIAILLSHHQIDFSKIENQEKAKFDKESKLKNALKAATPDINLYQTLLLKK